MSCSEAIRFGELPPARHRIREKTRSTVADSVPYGSTPYLTGPARMPISYVIDQTLQFVRTTVTGPVTVQEIVDHLSNQKRDRTVPFRELVDVTGVTTPYLSSSQIWQAAQAVLAIVLEESAGPRAVLVTNEAVYGMCRMFATLVEDTFPIRVFREQKAAEHWLLHEHAR